MENKKNTAASTPEMVTISRAEYDSQQAQLTELKLQNQWLLEQLGLARKRQFGASSERLQEGLMDQVDAVHLGEADVLTMDYAGRFQVEMHYHTDYSRDIRALLKTIEKLETNETGTIELTWDDGSVHFIGN